MLVNLSRGIATLGYRADFIVGQANGPYLSSLPDSINVIELGTTDKVGIINSTIAYLRQHQPDVILSAKEPANKIILLAKKKAGVSSRIFIRSVVNISKQVTNRNFIKRILTFRAVKQNYKIADGIIAVSRGVAEDIENITGTLGSTISVIPNPVITPELSELAKQPVAHNWFQSGQPPVILGVGRLGRQKNFRLLVEAFAEIRKTCHCRLVIAGNGRRRKRLLDLARKLGVEKDVWLSGYVDNPYSYMAHSRVFVLSSEWEGSPNVLTEALAVGTPVVSTDCPSGPREILANGKYGELVPMNDHHAMAQAIIRTLNDPPDSRTLKNAVIDYTMENSAAGYLRAMGMAQDSQTNLNGDRQG